MNNEPYDHTTWSDWRLEQRTADVQASATIPHNEPRRSDIQHELDCLAFEVGQRVLEAHNATQLIVELPEAS